MSRIRLPSTPRATRPSRSAIASSIVCSTCSLTSDRPGTAGTTGVPIHVTAPGVVSFTGVRTGYGNTIEVDHGGGFKTRYAHLSAISVKVGQHLALGERIGAMGSTGRSTGPHLHYEVWVSGRAENPDRFVKAGDYVQQTAG